MFLEVIQFLTLYVPHYIASYLFETILLMFFQRTFKIPTYIFFTYYMLNRNITKVADAQVTSTTFLIEIIRFNCNNII